MIRSYLSLVLFHLLFCFPSFAQFTRQDSLRGSIGPGRSWWDVLQYTINVMPDYSSKKIEGAVEIRFSVLEPGARMQIDLQQPMQVDGVVWNAFGDSALWNPKPLESTREGNVLFIDFPLNLRKGSIQKVLISYEGIPRQAQRPPWDGGWIWEKDAKARPWMSVACQGLGASAWFPCKDHQSDEPDLGAIINIDIVDTLVAVSNGRLQPSTHPEMLKRWTWKVSNPINNYNIIPYIGKYVTWHEDFAGEKGKLDCDYWVLDYNLEKAREQFKQVSMTLKAFEHWFGPYPFYEDGFKLVESPHLGMEHQSAVAYGNGFKNGYLGRDLSESGWGLKWDFIIVHETGHEWFGNNITSKDVADMWIHEGFTNYSETLFTDFHFGKEAGNAYCIGTRKLIQNDKPIIGPYGVNQEGSWDMYYKGGNMLHTIRQVINDDEKFRQILRGLNKEFYHKTVTTHDIEKYFSGKSGIDLSKIFDQYLRTAMIPTLEYRIDSRSLSFRWATCVPGFDMRVRLADGTWLDPTPNWKEMPLKEGMKNKVEVDKNFYVNAKKI